jgi:uncharacterized membrane protein
MRIAPRPSAALFAALAAAQVAYGKVPRLQTPAATRAIVLLMLAASATDAAEARGRRRGLSLVSLAGALGMVAEWVGTTTGRPFGRYAYSAKLGPRVRDVPVLAGAAWAMMARPSWVVAGRVARAPAPRAALAAGALTAWDVFLDPRMVREGYWRWAGGGAYEDVPLSNFLGWALTGLGVFALWAAADPWDEPEVNGAGALRLYAWTWLGETYANAALWKRPRVALAGGAAMGAFALPALLRR